MDKVAKANSASSNKSASAAEKLIVHAGRLRLAIQDLKELVGSVAG